MNPELLSNLFNFNHFVVQKNTEGLDHADSMRPPQPAGNCMNWVLGHILATRGSMHRLLELEPPLTEAAAEVYKRGSASLAPDDARAVDFQELMRAFTQSQQVILERIEALGIEGLADTIEESPLGEGRKGDLLAKLHFHEAYHAGQIGLLRRLTGRDGAIQ